MEFRNQYKRDSNYIKITQSHHSYLNSKDFKKHDAVTHKKDAGYGVPPT